MRDILIAGIVFGSLPYILRKPAIGVFMWIWLSVMNPHRLSFGFAYDFPFAQVVAIATFISLFITKEPKHFPLTKVTAMFLLFMLWMSFTTLFALGDVDYMWVKVMKIDVMVLVGLLVMHSRQHLNVLIWVLAVSVGFYGVKGGLFTLLGGGENRVYGPAGSFIEENNALAVAVMMTIPLLRYLQLQSGNRWVRWGLTGAMLLCVFAALGSHSRGALLAISAMGAFFWLKSQNKAVLALVLILLVPVAIGFMPDRWTERMDTIKEYESDGSAMGRINAWTMAFNLANSRPIGGGFEIYTGQVFAQYAPDPGSVHAAHSIYFAILGEHGYLGLAIFLLIWLFAWREGSWVIGNAKERIELKWAVDMARMIQVSFVGYAVGGAFLSLAYFDLPYYMMAALVLLRVNVEKELKSDAKDRNQTESKRIAAPVRRRNAYPGGTN